MDRINLYERKTHRYVDAWAHLDEWGKLQAVVSLTPSRVIAEADDYDEGPTTVRHGRIPAGMPFARLRILLLSLPTSNCRHEHDCCGCASYWGQIIRTGTRTFMIRETVRYNY